MIIEEITGGADEDEKPFLVLMIEHKHPSVLERLD